jgi:alkanesulfonate monooxygenase SsuD/methylene tetrahydromethanopterin reductase-like flavin-dependent oxidoreductase (luciferase family)
MPTTFGFTVSQRASLISSEPLRELLSIGADADQVDLIDTVWVGDSLTTKPRPDAVVSLSALAATTQRVRLGVACMATFPIRDPLQFALQWSALDQLSGGRTLLAVCNGIQKSGGKSEQEGGYFGGITDAERPALLERNVGIVRQLWTGQPLGAEFPVYEGLQISPTAQQPVPILLAGLPKAGTVLGDRFFDRVARIADGYMVTTRSGAQVAAAREQIGAAQDRQGIERIDLPITAYTGIGIGENRESVVDDAIDFFGRYYGPGIFTKESIGYAGIFGSPQQCIDELSELVQSGVDHLTLRLPSFQPRAQFERLVTEVLPVVAAESARGGAST